MKIHTDLTAPQMQEALDDSGIKGASLLMQEKGSRSHARRFDVYFDAEPMKGRRQSQHVHDGQYVTGITYDEWGLFIDRIFQSDPEAKVGPYKDRNHFRDVTDYRFDDLRWEDQHARHNFEFNRDHMGFECTGCDAIKFRNSSGFTA